MEQRVHYMSTSSYDTVQFSGEIPTSLAWFTLILRNGVKQITFEEKKIGFLLASVLVR